MLFETYRSIREGSIGKKVTQEKWKVGAKKALLQWVQSQVGRQLNIQVPIFIYLSCYPRVKY
jgi:hypothetical protein